MADSPHDDALTLATTRLAALDLDGSEDRIEQREILDEGWAAGVGLFPLWVVSGVGLYSDLGNPTTCTDDDEYPLLIRLVDRVKSWSAEERATHYKWLHIVVKAFRKKPLVMTYSGARCLDVLLLPSVTIEPEPLAYQLISRPLQFGIRIRQTRP